MPEDIWTEDVAARYDADSAALATPAVLDPVLDKLTALAGDGRALELAIGTGRVAVPLAERGVDVAGIELSPAMVAVLRRKAGDAIPVVMGDMATATVPGRFRLVYLIFNTISNLLSQDEQVACFRNAAAHLEPGGFFVIELGVPDLRRLPPGQLAVPFDVSEGHLSFATYDVVNQRSVSHHYTTRDHGQVDVFRSSHRYVWPAELDLMARLAGLVRVERSADWRGAPFTEDSTAHVSVWQKPAA